MDALADYQRVFPPPYSLSPNLALAMDERAKVARVRDLALVYNVSPSLDLQEAATALWEALGDE